MKEQNTTNPSEKGESKKAPGKPKREAIQESSGTWADYKAEFGKIVWPQKNEVMKKTVTVIFTSLLVSGIIFCMDFVYTEGYNLLFSLLG